MIEFLFNREQTYHNLIETNNNKRVYNINNLYSNYCDKRRIHTIHKTMPRMELPENWDEMTHDEKDEFYYENARAPVVGVI